MCVCFISTFELGNKFRTDPGRILLQHVGMAEPMEVVLDGSEVMYLVVFSYLIEHVSCFACESPYCYIHKRTQTSYFSMEHRCTECIGMSLEGYKCIQM